MRPVILLAGLAAALAASAAPAAAAGFQTPSRNIHCDAFPGDGSFPAQLRCDIRQKSWSNVPARPSNRDLEFGDSIGLRRRGRPFFVCHGDTTIDPTHRILRYGQSWHYLGFVCTSRTTGLTCRNAARHGFFMSKQSFRLF